MLKLQSFCVFFLHFFYHFFQKICPKTSAEVAVALPAEQKTGAFSACRVWPQILRAEEKRKEKNSKQQQHIICS